jgi:CRP/FNR family transcriptional activator FtrB
MADRLMFSIARNRSAEAERGSAREKLQAIALFADLSPQTWHALHDAMTIEELPSRTILLQEGEVSPWLYLVPEGPVQVFTSRAGRRTTITVLSAPALVPAEIAFCEGPSPVSARTLNRCTVGRIAAEDARALVRRRREVAELMSRHLALRWRDLLREAKGLRARTTLERLVSWICAMSGESHVPGMIVLPYEKAILAGRLGMAPETLSREFARLSRFGVTVRGRRIEVADPGALDGLTGDHEQSAAPFSRPHKRAP